MMQSGKQEVTTNNQSINNNASSGITRIQQPREAYLLNLADDILTHEIGQKLSMQDIYHLSRASYRLYTLFKKPASQTIHQFLMHVVRGDKNEVQATLDKYPCFLLEKTTVIDEAGRKIYGTAYQIALGAKDVSPFPEQYDEMAEMIASYFKKIPNGEIERMKQFNEQFPEGFELQEAKRQKDDLEALTMVFAAIKNATSIDEANAATEIFQDHLKKQTEGVIKSGYHFNDALFEEALKLYSDNYDDCGGSFSQKNKLIAIKVIGFIQRYFTANLAQSACVGFVSVMDKNIALSHTKLQSDGVSPFFSDKLGLDHFVYGYRGSWISTELVPCGFELPGFTKLMSNKNNSLVRHKSSKLPQQDNADEKKSWCAIS